MIPKPIRRRVALPLCLAMSAVLLLAIPSTAQTEAGGATVLDTAPHLPLDTIATDGTLEVSLVKALGCQMVYAELEPGVRVVAVEGSTIGSTEHELEPGVTETALTIAPPEWNNTQAASCATGEVFRPASELAHLVGMVMDESALSAVTVPYDRVAQPVYYGSQGAAFASGCGEHLTAGSRVFGCYYRYRGQNFHYATVSEASGKARGAYAMRSASTGSRYHTSRPLIRDWRPNQRIGRNSCGDVTLSYDNRSSGVGLEVSVRNPICSERLDIETLNSNHFAASWSSFAGKYSSAGSRMTEAIDVIYNEHDQPSGFQYVARGTYSW